MDLFEKCYVPALQDEIREKELYPYFHALESRQDVTVTMEGKRRIMLGSNNYLGLTVQPEVVEAGIAALRQYGTGCSGSRFLNGTLKLHLELEDALAEFLHQEAAMCFSTGFQSNLGAISAIAGHRNYILCDKENHASIYDGCRLSFARCYHYKHNDMQDLERLLASCSAKGGVLIVTDGVFSMTGEIANLPEIVRLARQYGARVMVDDAHGLGVLGQGGRGTPSYFGLEQEVDLYMGTFSKSLASLGGYVAGKARVIDYMRHASRPFIFSASIPPACAASALAALRYLQAHPERVQNLADLANYARSGMHRRGIPIIEADTPIIPIYTYDPYNTLETAKRIYEAGVYVNPVLPPACNPGECLLRTSYMATLTKPLIDEALDAIAQVMEEQIHG